MNCPHAACGCRYGAPCCLDCPLAECVLITHPTRVRPVRQRSLAIASYNQSTSQTATHFGVSMRTVWRIRRQHRLEYHRRNAAAWNKTPTGRETRASWRRQNPGRLAAYMRAWRTRALS